MKSSKVKKKKSDKPSKRVELDETQPDPVNEKHYITRKIETSVTLLDSPEENLVLEALLFLSKYADMQLTNLTFVHSCGLLPKLLALFDHNICIVRVSLRLLSQLLTVGAARLELNQERFDKDVRKICSFYMSHHPDPHVKEFSSCILATYGATGKAAIVAGEDGFVGALVKTISEPENDIILLKSLEMFCNFVEMEAFRVSLSKEQNFSINTLLQMTEKGEECFKIMLKIFEKVTYFGDDSLQQKLRESQIVERMFDLIVDPEKGDYIPTCLNVVTHCVFNDITRSYFVVSFEFLKFCQWVKTCPDEAMEKCANIFLELSKIDSIRQMLFDLSIEDTILSFLRSDAKKILNATCQALSLMSKHKYCCEKIVTPVVVKKLLQIMRRSDDADDSENEVALGTLYYFCRRDSRTIHMISSCGGMDVISKFLREKKDKLSSDSYRKVLEIVNMFVTNNHLRSLILSPDLYDVILTQTSSEFDEICMRSLEIMINCLNYQDFQNYFLLNKGSEIVATKLSGASNEKVIRLLTILIHNSLVYENLARDLVHKKILLLLKNIPEGTKHRNPLIERVINLIYGMCLPLKFFETNRLDFTDKINERFYVITGSWSETFPFLEVLELRKMSTLHSVYVVDGCGRVDCDAKDHDCLSIQQQYTTSISGCTDSLSSALSLQTRCPINYGLLSPDPYLPKYVSQVQRLLADVPEIETRIKSLAAFVDECLCGPDEKAAVPDRLHTFKFHIECIKHKLGTNMIPIGYLRSGFHCERALLFKALADHVYIPATLVKRNKLYWNEVALIRTVERKSALKMFVVDLMNNIGRLLPVGSRESNVYCDIQ